MPLLTVFTPAYNRAHTIARTYASMCRQSCHDFEWLIIDDGSTDHTQSLVRSWLNPESLADSEYSFSGTAAEAPWLKIRYIHQENQGMHGAHNTAYRNITTELNTCIDSDDYMPDNAVELIASFWQALPPESRNKFAGIIGLDVDDKHRKLIGEPFPDDLKHTTLSAFYNNGGRGDKKIVYRTDVICSVPEYPIFEGERYVGLNYKYILVDQSYELLVLNAPLVIVDYQPDGSTASMYRQYWNNPKGWSFYRKFQMTHTSSLSRKFKACIHYVSSSIICHNRRFINESPRKLLTILAIPFGFALYLKTKRAVNQ